MAGFPRLERADRARGERARVNCRSTPLSLTTHPARAPGSRRGVVFLREVQCHDLVARHDWFSIPPTAPGVS